MTLWNIWRDPNEKIWSDTEVHPQQSISRALQFLHKWKHARKSQLHSTPHTPQHAPNMKKPQIGFWKCNVDAAIFTSSNKFGVALCLSDHHGQFIQAKCICKKTGKLRKENIIIA